MDTTWLALSEAGFIARGGDLIVDGVGRRVYIFDDFISLSFIPMLRLLKSHLLVLSTTVVWSTQAKVGNHEWEIPSLWM